MSYRKRLPGRRNWPLFSLLEQFLELGNDGIANLNSGGLAANVACADTSLDNVLDSLLDDAGLIEHAERVLHHHGDGEDSGDGVDDALAGNIGGRAWYNESVTFTQRADDKETYRG